MSAVKGVKAVLNNGQLMPLLGLGCWQSPVDVVAQAVEAALDCGYTHIDTAYNYLNEEGVGDGIEAWLKKSGSNRSDLFIVTKLPLIGMHEGGIEKFLKLSLKKLKLDYVDLYLIHVPIGLKSTGDDNDTFPKGEDDNLLLDNSTDHIAIWKEMERMVDAGLTRSIGVSNFDTKQMKKIIANSRIPPAVNQVEMHVNFQQSKMQRFCDENKIVLTSYGPLGSPGRPDNLKVNRKAPELLTNPVVTLVANNHNVTTAQVLIRFWVQQGVVCIPKSVTPSRIKSNGEVFDFHLSDVEMEALKMLDKGEEGRSFTFFRLAGLADHPECPLPEE